MTKQPPLSETVKQESDTVNDQTPDMLQAQFSFWLICHNIQCNFSRFGFLAVTVKQESYIVNDQKQLSFAWFVASRAIPADLCFWQLHVLLSPIREQEQ